MDPLPRPIRKPASLFSGRISAAYLPSPHRGVPSSGIYVQNVIGENYWVTEGPTIIYALLLKVAKLDKISETNAEVVRGAPLSPPELLQTW